MIGMHAPRWLTGADPLKTGYYLLLSLFLFFSLVAGASAGDAGKVLLTPAEKLWLKDNQSGLVLAVETGYPPFVFLDAKGRPAGLAHDYLLLIESKLGIHFKQRQFSSLDDILSKARSGEVHIVNAVTKTPQRSEFLSFTEPFISVPNVIVVRKERSGKLLEKDLAGLKVSLVKSYAITEHLAKSGLDINIDLVPDDLGAILNVSFGRSDAAVIDLATATYLISLKGITNLRVAGEASSGVDLSIGVPHSAAPLRDILQKGLDASSQGERDTIRQRWIHTASDKIFTRRFWIASAVVLVTIIGVMTAILVWNRTLRRLVAIRTEDLAKEKYTLQLSEKRYRTIVESQTEFVERYLPGGVLTFVNEALARFTGVTAETLLGRSFYQFILEADREECVRQIESISRGNPTVESECRIELADGSIRWTHWRQTGIFDDQGTLLEYQSVGWDVTERKVAEEALRASQQRLNFYVEHSPLATVEWDSGFIVTRWAGAAEKIFGWTSAEVIGKPIMDLQLVYEEDLPVVQSTMQQLIDGSEYVIACNRNYTKERKIISCEWYNTVLTDAQGHMASVLSQVLDVTERKRTEKYKEMAREVLQILNEPGTLEELLPHVLTALKAWTGFDAVGVRFQKGDDYPYIVDDGFPKDFLLVENTLVKRSMDGGICRDDEGSVCLECTCGLVISGKTDPANPLFTKGGSFWINDSPLLLEIPPAADPRLHPRNECIHRGYASVALVPIRDDGRIVGLIQFNDKRKNCFTLDTVERLEDIAMYIGGVLMRKRIDEEKLALQQQLLHAQKLESLGVLAGGVAHDFNNILTAIIGNADLAMMRLNPDSPAMENLRQIENSSTRAADLARQMLAYSGKGRFVIEPIDLNRLLEEMVHMLEVSISKKAVIQFNLHNPLPMVEADATQIRQVVMNLVINASEAIGDSSGTIAITTGCSDFEANQLKCEFQNESLPEGRYVFLEIADSGCGMDKETMARIFDPFFTTKFTGRGLGMAAVQGIVRGHKGTIKVCSEPGKGSAFKVLLPAPARQPELLSEDAPRDSWKSEGKVLLVDDEESVRAIGTALLKELGFVPITAANGLEGIEIFNQNPDIVFAILDLTMPIMDGEQCLLELKQLKPDLKVFISSGYSEQEVAEKFVNKGLTGFIQKPYKLSVLREALQRANNI